MYLIRRSVKGLVNLFKNADPGFRGMGVPPMLPPRHDGAARQCQPPGVPPAALASAYGINRGYQKTEVLASYSRLTIPRTLQYQRLCLPRLTAIKRLQPIKKAGDGKPPVAKEAKSGRPVKRPGRRPDLNETLSPRARLYSESDIDVIVSTRRDDGNNLDKQMVDKEVRDAASTSMRNPWYVDVKRVSPRS